MVSETMPYKINDKTAAQDVATTPWKRLEVPITGIFCTKTVQSFERFSEKRRAVEVL